MLRCKKGKQLNVSLLKDGVTKDTLHATACPLHYPNPGAVESSSVQINLKVTTP